MKQMNRKFLVSVMAIAIILLGVFSAGAQEIDTSDLPWKRFTLSAGGFFNSIDSSLRYGLSGVGLEVDMEEALGLDTSMFIFKTDATWCFSKNLRHRLNLGWFAINRKSSKVLKEDLQFGDYYFPAGTKAESSFNFDIIKSSYSYSYFQDNRFDLAASFGFYVMPISFEVKSDVGEIRESDNLTAPLPVFGLHNNFAITPKVFLKNSLDFFYIEYDQFRGSVTDIQVAVEYRAFENVGFGLGVESFRLKIKSEKSTDYPGVDFDGDLTLSYLGAMLYVTAYY